MFLFLQPPQPAEKWEGVRDASYGARKCMQMLNTTAADDESEDCLYLQVYTPEVTVKNIVTFFTSCCE